MDSMDWSGAGQRLLALAEDESTTAEDFLALLSHGAVDHRLVNLSSSSEVGSITLLAKVIFAARRT